MSMMIVPGYAWTVHRAGANRKVHRAMGDTNPRFRYDQILQTDLDLMDRLTEDYTSVLPGDSAGPVGVQLQILV